MAEPIPFPGPDAETDPALAVRRRLDYYRATVLAKLESLPPAELRTSRLPSGWSPLELGWHLLHMERRWFGWGFLAEPTAEPWADHAPDEPGRWVVPSDLTTADLTAAFARTSAETTSILRTTPLDTLAAVGGRFDRDPPSLLSICLHVLQEYARHAGHLDVAVELAGGRVGE